MENISEGAFHSVSGSDKENEYYHMASDEQIWEQLDEKAGDASVRSDKF